MNCASITTNTARDKGRRASWNNRPSMSDTQITAMTRLQERSEALKERL